MDPTVNKTKEFFRFLTQKFSPQTLIIGSIIVGLFLYFSTGNHYWGRPKSPPAAVASLAKNSSLFKVRYKKFTAQNKTHYLSLMGYTIPSQVLDIKSRTQGYVDVIKCDEGDQVTKDQILVQLSPDDRKEQLDEANALLQQRRMELETARSLAKQQYGSRTDLARAVVALEEAEAKKVQIEQNISYTTIKAPYGGIVDKIVTEIGDYVDNSNVLLTLAALDPLKVEVFVAEHDYNLIRKGMKGVVKLATGDEVPAVVDTVSALVDSKTRAYRLNLKIDNPGYKIPSGMTAEVKLPVAEQPMHIIPAAVLTLHDDGRVGIKYLDDEDVVVFQPLDIVEFDEHGITATGLPETLRLITVGHDFVKEGAHVIGAED